MSPAESIGKIQQILSEHGASRVQMEYNGEGKPESLSFSMFVGGQELFFKLTVDVAGMLQAMKDDKNTASTYCNREQAERTAWKNKLEWLQIQISEAEANQARLEQLLLGWAVTDTGENLYHRIRENNQLQIAEGK